MQKTNTTSSFAGLTPRELNTSEHKFIYFFMLLS
jgi:hypothetical protein